MVTVSGLAVSWNCWRVSGHVVVFFVVLFVAVFIGISPVVCEDNWPQQPGVIPRTIHAKAETLRPGNAGEPVLCCGGLSGGSERGEPGDLLQSPHLLSQKSPRFVKAQS